MPSHESAARRAPAVPPGTRVYAVGDIHGRLDLLDEINAAIAADISGNRPARSVVLYLGDYVDRGPDSRDVIDRLIDPPVPATQVVRLCGNHERFMLDFLDHAHIGSAWMANGGDATLRSYGIAIGRFWLDDRDLRRAQAELARALPPAHLDFLQALALWHDEGDYLFVHAGIRPGIPLERQDAEDLIWIREEFLESEADHGRVVVHGHTIAAAPEIRPNRIGIDTGAYASGRLTCLVLEGAQRRFLQTGD